MDQSRKNRLASEVVADTGVVSEQFQHSPKPAVPQRTEKVTKTVTETRDGLDTTTETTRTTTPSASRRKANSLSIVGMTPQTLVQADFNLSSGRNPNNQESEMEVSGSATVLFELELQEQPTTGSIQDQGDIQFTNDNKVTFKFANVYAHAPGFLPADSPSDNTMDINWEFSHDQRAWDVQTPYGPAEIGKYEWNIIVDLLHDEMGKQNIWADMDAMLASTT